MMIHLSEASINFCFLYCQEVDEPLQLDMSELCLDDDFIRGSGKSALELYL